MVKSGYSGSGWSKSAEWEDVALTRQWHGITAEVALADEDRSRCDMWRKHNVWDIDDLVGLRGSDDVKRGRHWGPARGSAWKHRRSVESTASAWHDGWSPDFQVLQIEQWRSWLSGACSRRWDAHENKKGTWIGHKTYWPRVALILATRFLGFSCWTRPVESISTKEGLKGTNLGG